MSSKRDRCRELFGFFVCITYSEYSRPPSSMKLVFLLKQFIFFNRFCKRFRIQILKPLRFWRHIQLPAAMIRQVDHSPYQCDGKSILKFFV